MINEHEHTSESAFITDYCVWTEKKVKNLNFSKISKNSSPFTD
jgi:hypothetical protein